MRLRSPKRPEYVPQHFRYVGPTLLQWVRSVSWVELVARIRSRWYAARPIVKAVAGVVYLLLAGLIMVTSVRACEAHDRQHPRPSWVTPSPYPAPAWRPPVR